MTIHHIILATLVTFTMASACTKNQSAEKPHSDKSVVLNVSLSPFTKAIMVPNGALLWKSGDIIGIWDGTSVQKYTVRAADITGDSSSATIELSVSSDADRLIVVYPYDEADSFTSDGLLVTGAARVELGSELRTQIKAIGICGADDGQVVLKNFNTVLRFSIASDLVKGISLEGNDGERLLCRTKVDPSNPCNGFKVESADYKKLYLTNMSGKGTYYLGLLPGVNLTKGWKIQVFSKISMSRSTLLGEVRKNDALSLVAGCFADLGTLEYVEPEVIHNSNCYYISSPGTYSLPLRKGNSEIEIPMVSSASVLWESVGTVSPPQVGSVVSEVTINEETGQLDYTVTSTPGNAVIAALDATGAVLWSWHIWNVQQDIKTVTLSNGRVVLDRNLGALAVEDAGLMYQWGRKDPFLGASAPNAGGTELVQATTPVNNGSPVLSSETAGTVEYTILHPTQWIQSVQASAWNWYFAKNEDGLWSAEKTIYDPCPAGYRVIDTEVWTGVEKWTLPLSGRLAASGKTWNIAPGRPTYYWEANAPGSGNTTSNSMFVGAAGELSEVKSSRGLGMPIRCVKE